MKHTKLIRRFFLSLLLVLPLVSNSVQALQDDQPKVEEKFEKPPLLKYSWRKGIKYGYEFDLEIEIDGEQRDRAGQWWLRREPDERGPLLEPALGEAELAGGQRIRISEVCEQCEDVRLRAARIRIMAGEAVLDTDAREAVLLGERI